MEFLSPKTKERIAKLEAENAELRDTLDEKLSVSSSRGLWPLILVIVALGALSIYQYLESNKSNTEDFAAIRTEMWRSGEVVDTVLSPKHELVYSVQIGAFKNQSVSDLSLKFVDASLVAKDSLSAFVIGKYRSLPDAQRALDIVVNLGVENAFIIAQKNGKAVGLLSKQNRE